MKFSLIWQFELYFEFCEANTCAFSSSGIVLGMFLSGVGAVSLHSSINFGFLILEYAFQHWLISNRINWLVIS